MSAPRTLIAANWKLHKNPRESLTFFEEWDGLAKTMKLDPRRHGVLFFPPATSLETAGHWRQKDPRFEFGAQNCCSEASGAFTGEISAAVVKELGAHFVLIGHSERRSLFHEKDDLLARKVALVQTLGLTPMLCIGETLAEREKGETNAVLSRQLKQGLSQVVTMASLAIAYEPVWAIGTGKVASLEQVAEAHAFIRSELQHLGQSDISILYGGSVKADNAVGLADIANVNGFLVGGASLDPKSFAQIVRAALNLSSAHK